MLADNCRGREPLRSATGAFPIGESDQLGVTLTSTWTGGGNEKKDLFRLRVLK